MTINVYWSCLEKEWLMAVPPQSVSKAFYEKEMFNPLTAANLNLCPAFNKNLKNLYQMKSIYDYEFFINGDNVYSKTYDQDFFDSHVYLRDMNLKMFSFKQSFVFFTDAPTLPTTFYEFPVFEDNEITKRCIIVPGSFDIAKWYRSGEFAFYLKKEFDSFKINSGDVMYYIRFHTEEKINFIQFRNTEKLNQYQKDGFMLNSFAGFKKIEQYYEKFYLKNLILKEIKKNIL
jgi:hypothetical protein